MATADQLSVRGDVEHYEEVGWDWRLGDVRRPPFLLPDLVAAVNAGRTIYLPEGERDVLSLRAIGLDATTNAGGAGKGACELADRLRGADVVILPDNDQAGQDHADALADALHGIAARVRVVLLPGLPPKGAVTDFLDFGGTAAVLQSIVNGAPDWSPPTSAQAAPDPQRDADVPPYDLDPDDWQQPAALGEPPDDPDYAASLSSAVDHTPPGAMTGEDWALMEPVATGQSIPASEAAKAATGDHVMWRQRTPWAVTSIPKRPWLAPGYLLRGAVTALAGAGSAGKSSLVIAWTAALSIGCAFGQFKPIGPLKVLSYNVEDNENEQMRRYQGMFDRLAATPDMWEGRLEFNGPTQVGTLVTANARGGLLVNTPVMDRLEAIIQETRPDVVFFDPFVELHNVDENDNTAIRAVVAFFRALAKKYDMAVVILAHTRKGALVAGDPDSMRGASSIVGAARVVLTMNTMSEDDAKDLGILAENRRHYVRIDGAKMNYSAIEGAEWFEKQSHRLSNRLDCHGEPCGDDVVVLWPWTPPTVAVSPDTIATALKGIEDGSPNGPWSPKLVDTPRSFCNLCLRIGVDSLAAQKALLAILTTTQGVVVAKYKVPRRSIAQAPQGLRTADFKPPAKWLS